MTQRDQPTLGAAVKPIQASGQNGGMNRSADWLQQAQADLNLAGVSAGAGHHEWACFACHQAVEKALKALHLHHNQQAWGHGLGRCFRDLPASVRQTLAAAVSDLEDRLRVLDALYIPTRYPDSLPDGAPSDHFGRLQSDDALRHAHSIVDAIAAALA
ncbi:MAG: HEPN domain-containing protein [Cyanobium sp.]